MVVPVSLWLGAAWLYHFPSSNFQLAYAVIFELGQIFTNLFLFIAVFSPFMFNVIIDMLGLRSALLYSVFSAFC